MGLFDSFRELPAATSSGEFKATPVSGRRKDFLAKTECGGPMFLLHDSSIAKYRPGISFRHVSAQFHASCRVQVDSACIEDQFCLLECDDSAPELYELFVRCVSASIEELPEVSGTKDIEQCILQLGDLFRALSRPSSREVSGLWAELFVLVACGNPEHALKLWHEDQFDRFDFSSESLRMEVKSSVRGVRAHEFSLEQLRAPECGEGYVASVLLQPLTGGASVLDLALELEGLVVSNAELRKKIWKNVAKSLGADFSDKLDKRFDRSFAGRNLMIYSMADIPQPAAPADARISSLRFAADLTGVISSIGESPTSALSHIFSAKPAPAPSRGHKS